MSSLSALFRSGIRATGRRLLGLGAGRKAADFRNLFSQFRQVLDLHNAAAERIADMGEKLSGEYLFDIVYLRRAYGELHRIFSDFLGGFSSMTGNRYAELQGRLGHIDREIRRLIDEEDIRASDFVLPLNAAGTCRLRAVGGKMANLAELGRLPSVTIPRGFVITTRSFDEFLRYNNLDNTISVLSGRWETDASALNDVRSAILAGKIPPGVSAAISGALDELTGRGPVEFLAVRSSAVGEDGEYSFAGQFDTVLNVPADMPSLVVAYRQVIASLYFASPFLYCKRIGCNGASIKMAVGCISMIDAEASGVTYSSDPSGNRDQILINASWGLGKSVVEGQVDADTYRLVRSPRPVVQEKRIGTKSTMTIPMEDGGTALAETPAERVQREVLSQRDLLALSDQALQIEQHFHVPQDIEWAIDRNGRIIVLQARPLAQYTPHADKPLAAPHHLETLMKFSGIPVRKGVGAGEVFIPATADDLDGFPKGGVLVARHDSSHYIGIMPLASAILTDMGTPTSHMSSLCREFRVPAAVNCANATSSLTNGMQVTVHIGEDGAVVYKGLHRDLFDMGSSDAIEELYEFRTKKYLLRYILPLNLVDPFSDNFSPEACRTLHDILRFVHEKMVMELVEHAKRGLSGGAAVHLALPVPAGIMAVDLDGGILPGTRGNTATIDQISSIPLRAILEGLTYPGAWHTEVVPLQAGDLFAGMMKLPDLTAPSASRPTANLAVVSREYLNLSLKFGYHYTMLDCYCSPLRTNNHIYFRFSGGATDLLKQSRRIRLIEHILRMSGFVCRNQGGLITARVSNIGEDEMIGTLNQIGRLLAYTRQLDAVLHSDGSVEVYIGNFLRGDYRL